MFLFKTKIIVFLLLLPHCYLFAMESLDRVPEAPVVERSDNQCVICCREFVADVPHCQNVFRYQLAERASLTLNPLTNQYSFERTCGHSLCRDCLAGCIGNGDTRCPFCRSYICNEDLKQFVLLPEDELNKTLLRVARIGTGEAVRESLVHGANPWCFDEEGYNPLHRAVMANNVDGVLELLQAISYEKIGNYLRVSGGKGAETVLMLAGSRSFIEIIKILLSVIPVNQRLDHIVHIHSSNYSSTLLLALENSKKEVAGLLVSMLPQEQRYACLNASLRWCMNAIHMVAFLGDLPMLRLLLSLLSAEQQRQIANEVVSGFLSFDDNGQTALHLAAKHGKVGVVRFLLDCGANPLIKDAKGKTPYEVATTQAIKDLIRKA